MMKKEGRESNSMLLLLPRSEDVLLRRIARNSDGKSLLWNKKFKNATGLLPLGKGPSSLEAPASQLSLV
jgi:hypothetical protein